MYSMYVDFSDEECKRELRSLELIAYANIVDVFRAQGPLTNERKKLLQDISNALGISMDRHRAEARRAAYDEHLNTIAERLYGPNSSFEWAMEGRRVVPLMERLAPHTVFTEIANSAANVLVTNNATLPPPNQTGVRLINGKETIAHRKRRDYVHDDVAASPAKIPAMDRRYFHSVLPPGSIPEQAKESSVKPKIPFKLDKIPTAPGQQAPLPPNLKISKSLASLLNNSAAFYAKHQLSKPSTITSLDQMSQIQSSSQAPTLVASLEKPTPLSSESPKPFIDVKNPPRQLLSVNPMKASTVVIPTGVSSLAGPVKERLPTTAAACQSSIFLPQPRSKTPIHTRQNIPVGLGIKLAPQTQVSQPATVHLSQPSMKVKHESPSLFAKKAAAFSSLLDSQGTPFSVNLPLTDSLAISKSSLPKAIARIDTNPSSTLNQAISSKQFPLLKTLPKTTTSLVTASHNPSGYISRSLFPATSMSTKSLPPVIFNVASTACTTLQTATKTTSEAGKVTTQLLPKSTTVGISSSHLKINTSTTQTIQYRNDGGLVRSARIVNIAQPIGTRLPCAISPSAISALGLSSTLPSTGMRVTLPAGTLNPTPSLRVSSASKPNVIVVHKAQMWPKAQQGAAVVMSSTQASKMPTDTTHAETQPIRKTSADIKEEPGLMDNSGKIKPKDAGGEKE